MSKSSFNHNRRNYRIVASDRVLEKIKAYKKLLMSNLELMGAFFAYNILRYARHQHFDDILSHHSDYFEYTVQSSDAGSASMTSKMRQDAAELACELTDEQFLELLIQTKKPKYFTKFMVASDPAIDWNQHELSIIGDISFVVPATFYDNGKYGALGARDIHDKPFLGTLLYTPGALLQSSGAGSDLAEVTKGGKGQKIDQKAFNKLYERRLLPTLIYANNGAKRKGKKAFITLPNIGYGIFSGKFEEDLEVHLKIALEALLKKYSNKLKNIAAIYYDPYQNRDIDNKQRFGHVDLITKSSLNDGGRTQLCHPSSYGQKYDNCELYSVVDCSRDSWPGGNAYMKSEKADDGNKARATSSMETITGFLGYYDYYNKGNRRVTNSIGRFNPSEDGSWLDIVRLYKIQLPVKDKIVMVNNKGVVKKLSDSNLVNETYLDEKDNKGKILSGSIFKDPRKSSLADRNFRYLRNRVPRVSYLRHKGHNYYYMRFYSLESAIEAANFYKVNYGVVTKREGEEVRKKHIPLDENGNILRLGIGSRSGYDYDSDKIKEYAIVLTDNDVGLIRDRNIKIAKDRNHDYDSIRLARSRGYFAVKDDDNYKFSAAEIMGDRDGQGDEMGLAQVDIDNPEEYLRKRFFAMVEHNKNQDSGTTAAMYYFDPKKKEITIANLGDSRVYLVVKNKKEKKPFVFLLTQDHDLSLDRIQKHIQSQGGEIVGNRVLGLGMGASIGDGYCKVKGKDLLLRSPDITVFNIEDSIDAEYINDCEFTIVNACDGLTDHMKSDNCEFVTNFKSNNTQRLKDASVNHEVVGKNSNILSKKIRMKSGNQELAKYLVDDANNSGSTDNISVSTCSFSGATLSSSAKGVLGFVFDGHALDKDKEDEVSQNCLDYMAMHLNMMKNNKRKYEAIIDHVYDEKLGSKHDTRLQSFNRGIDSKSDDFNPNTSYRGLGLRVNIVDKYRSSSIFRGSSMVKKRGLNVSEVFPPNNRFLRYDRATKGWVSSSFPVHETITGFGPKDNFVNIDNLIKEKGMKLAKQEIAKYFHQKGFVRFRASDGAIYGHDNTKNKSAIWAPKSTSYSSEDLQWLSLSEMLKTNANDAQKSIQRTTMQDDILSPSAFPSKSFVSSRVGLTARAA